MESGIIGMKEQSMSLVRLQNLHRSRKSSFSGFSGIVVSRFDRLPADVQIILKTATVLGRSVFLFFFPPAFNWIFFLVLNKMISSASFPYTRAFELETLSELLSSSGLMKKSSVELGEILENVDLVLKLESTKQEDEFTIDDGSCFAFQSDLIKEALYNLMVDDQRKALHAK
jgi:hypothetical protein